MYVQVVCLSPTYELAIQTGEVAAKMSSYCPNITLRYAVRGEDGWYISIKFYTVIQQQYDSKIVL